MHEALDDSFYTSPAWRALAERVKARDGSRCTVARLLGGSCSAVLTVHHIEKRRDRPELELDDDNCATVCSAHHPTWESLRSAVERSRQELPDCGHFHPYRSGRIACARRRARKAGIVLTGV